jgi:3',5'-cyclic AMP phosphodiesterase CpdA
MQLGGLDVAIVAVDSSKPDLDEGQIGREHYAWIAEGFAGAADLRVFVCHHHLVAIPGTGRDRNQLMDAGDVLALLRDCRNDIVLSGHRHVPYLWPIAGMYLIHSGTVSTTRTRGFPDSAYNLVRVADEQIEVELRVPGGVRHSLGRYPRNWPEALTAREADPFTRFSRGGPLASPGGPSTGIPSP